MDDDAGDGGGRDNDEKRGGDEERRSGGEKGVSAGGEEGGIAGAGEEWKGTGGLEVFLFELGLQSSVGSSLEALSSAGEKETLCW